MTGTTKNHEQDLAILRVEIGVENLTKSMKEWTAKVDKTLEKIPSMDVQIGKNKTSINRLWILSGTMFTAILGLAFFLIQSGLAKAMGM